MSFQSLGLMADLLRAISDKGYNEPTPIQIQAIPVILEGRDVLAGAQTGTGKTAGFTLPLLQRLSAPAASDGRRAVRALILTPTRELAAQVEESVRNYGKHLPLQSAVIFGGVGFTPQADALRRGVDILVATPGRLLDHVQQKTLDLGAVEILVLDEADRMLDMGFIRDIRKILALLPKKRQNLLFSATYSEDIRLLADSFLHEPVLIEVARRNTAAELVNQVVHPVDRERKRELLSHLIHTQGWKQVLVFTRTKHGANRLAEQLGKDGITASAIHGNKSQGARTKALADFKRGAVRVLVATDIAARGLDIDQLPHVVNYELPNVPEDYVHRIGRTGRAGNEGEAMSLVCVDERDFLRAIEQVLNREVAKVVVEGFTPDPSIKAEPILLGRGGGRNPSRGGGRHAAPRREPGQQRNSGQDRHSKPAQGMKPAQGHGPRRDNDPRRDSPPRRDGKRYAPGGRSQAPRQPFTPFRDEHGDADGNRIPPASPPASPPPAASRAADQQPHRQPDRQPHQPPRTQRSPGPSRHGKPPRRHRGEVPALLGGHKDRD